MDIQSLCGAVLLEMDVYRPMKAGDASNRIKLLEDSLSGFAFNDDKQVVGIVLWRFEDPLNPRVEVRISPVTPRIRGEINQEAEEDVTAPPASSRFLISSPND